MWRRSESTVGVLVRVLLEQMVGVYQRLIWHTAVDCKHRVGKLILSPPIVYWCTVDSRQSSFRQWYLDRDLIQGSHAYLQCIVKAVQGGFLNEEAVTEGMDTDDVGIQGQCLHSQFWNMKTRLGRVLSMLVGRVSRSPLFVSALVNASAGLRVLGIRQIE